MRRNSACESARFRPRPYKTRTYNTTPALVGGTVGRLLFRPRGEMDMALAVDGGDGGVGDGGAEDSRARPGTRILRCGESAAQEVARLRDLKNSLIGEEKAKRSALALFIVQDVLNFLDTVAAAAAGGSSGNHYESALLHGIGLLVILCSPPLPGGLAEMYIAPSGSKIVGHIMAALKIASFPSSSASSSGSTCDRSSRGSSSEKLTATALRAISSMCASVVPTAKYQDGAAREAAASAVKEEREASLALLKDASGLILDEVVNIPTPAGGERCRKCWSPGLRTLGLEALAAMTRVEVRMKLFNLRHLRVPCGRCMANNDSFFSCVLCLMSARRSTVFFSPSSYCS